MLTPCFLVLFSYLSFGQNTFQYLMSSESSIESMGDANVDGTYMYAADSYNDTADYFHRIIIQRMDNNGEVKSSVGYFRPPSYRLSSLTTTSDSGAIVLATSNIPLENEDSVLILKLDANDDLEWSKSFQVEKNIHEPKGTLETKDGSFLVYGTYEHVNFASGIYLVKIDKGGSLVWSRTINSALSGAYMKVGGIVEMANGEFWLSGSTRFNSEGSWLAKLNSSGETQSVIRLNTHKLTPSQPEPFAFFANTNGDLDIFYNNTSYEIGAAMLWVVTDGNGSVKSATRLYNGDNYAGFIDVEQVAGGYVFTGYNYPPSSNRSNGIATEIGLDKSVKWARTYGSNYIEYTGSISKASDGGYYMAGFADFDSLIISPSENGLFPWIVKTNSTGVATCYSEPTSITLKDTSVTTVAYNLSNVAGVSLAHGRIEKIPVHVTLESVDCTGVGVKESEPIAISLYPNPSNGTCYLEVMLGAIKNVEVISVLGEKLNSSIQVNGTKAVIACDYRGLAFVTITTDHGSATKKIYFK